MTLAIDFDGTIIEDGCYPNLGPEIAHACRVMIKLKSCGHKLILWTCRWGKPLNDAIAWCKLNGVVFDAVNINIPIEGEIDLKDIPRSINDIEQYIDGKTFRSPKIYADRYIDNRSEPPFAGWLHIEALYCK